MEGGLWGVIIVGCAFMIQVISFGTESTIGVYNIEFLEYFKDQTVGVSLIGSINFGVYLASGPIVSLMMTKLSYRKIALGGSFLVVTGLLGMRAYPYIPTMCFFFGVLTGFGNCCVYIPSHVLSGLYFEKYRSLATGISNSGSGLGGAIMPVLAGIFIDLYSWKGSLVILAGLNLHLFIFCALLQEPPEMASWHVRDMEMEVVHNGTSGVDISLTETETVTDDRTKLKPSPSICISNSLESPAKVKVEDFKIVQDEKGLQFWGLDNSKLDLLETETFNTRSLSSHGFIRENSHELDSQPSSLMLYTENRVMWKSHSFVQPSARKVEVRQLYLGVKSSSFQPAIMGWRGSCLVYDDDEPQMNEIDLNDQEVPLKKDEDKQQLTITSRPKSSRHIFIFTNYGFDVYFLSNMLWNAGYTIIQSFAPEFMREQGISPLQVAWLSGSFGFGCFIGGLFGACCGNVKRINRKLLYTLANVAMGSMMLLFPNYNHLVFFAVTLVMSGLAFGIILGLLIIVLTDLIGPQSLGNGIGYLMLSNGVGAFLGPPVASVLRESTGGFKAAIYLAGVLCILGGLVMLLMPCQQFLPSNKTRRANEDECITNV